MEFISLYGLFLAKLITLVIAMTLLIGSLFVLRKRHPLAEGELKLTDLSEQYEERQRTMQSALLKEAEKNFFDKKVKQQQQVERKLKKRAIKSNKVPSIKSCLYVIDFKGSIDAHEVSVLREEISAILSVATQTDEVLLRLESPGGVVHGYGLAASQLQRLREARIRLTVAVDKVAASGGYMMACVADHIISAPFAIIGSIGVVAQLPNFHRLLQKNDIDLELHTAGKFKRTLTLFGENTPQGREKFCQDLQEAHQLFQHFVQQHRPTLDIDEVATGEHWFGLQAKEKKLVDAISTSDEFVITAMQRHKVISVNYVYRQHLLDRLTGSLAKQTDNLLLRWYQRMTHPLG